MTTEALTIKRGDGTERKILGYRFAPEKLSNRKQFAASGSNPKLPPKVDLRQYLTEIEDQQNTNSCVANAVAGAYEYLVKKHEERDYDVSRLFIYYNARDLGGIEGDNGSMIADAIEGLRNHGACAEDSWPFAQGKVNKRPTDEAYEEAEQFVVEDMQLVPVNLTAWKNCLAEGYPIIFGISLYESFDQHRKKGVVPLPTPKEASRESHGGHAMLCVGYSDPDRVFIVRNSWGANWGDNGYCYIPYDYLVNPKYNDGDCWIIRQLENFELDQESWGDDTSLIGDFDTELGNMSEEDYGTLLDAMGDHPLELRMAVIFLTAAGADGDLSDDELAEIATYFAAVIESLGVNTQVDRLLRRAASKVGDEELLEESIELLGEHLSATMLASIVNSITEIAGTDELEDSEDEFVAGLIEAWQVTDEEGDEEEEDEEAASSDTEEEGEEEDESEERSVVLTGFWIYTDNAEKVIKKIEKLCAAHCTESDDYEYEWEEDEDDDGAYIEFSNFEASPDNPDAFLEALEALCDEISADGGYSWD